MLSSPLLLVAASTGSARERYITHGASLGDKGFQKSSLRGHFLEQPQGNKVQSKACPRCWQSDGGDGEDNEERMKETLKMMLETLIMAMMMMMMMVLH